MKLLGRIPFETLSQRHLVYAYCAVWLIQGSYAFWLWSRFRQFRGEQP